MPRYFFDTDDGNSRVRDGDGVELSGREDARRLAQATLPDMAHDSLPNGEHQDFTVRVRDEGGTLIYSARLELTGRWHA